MLRISNLCILICFLFCFISIKTCLSIGVDTLLVGQSLTPTQTLISKDEIFELGFFTPSNQNMYLGIWYKNFPQRTIVWVANRQSPLPPNSKLEISSNGNLQLLSHESDILWSTNLIVPTNLPNMSHSEAVLLDSGNFILRDGSNPTTIFWQSFDHLTDTWLPGAFLGFNRINGRKQRLVSWRNTDDPSPGLFSIEISQDQTFQFFLSWNFSTTYWKSGYWNGVVFGSVPEISYLTDFNFVTNENESYYSYSVLNNNVFSMLVINATGSLEQLTSLKNHNRDWSTTFFVPKSKSEIFGFCGAFGILSDNPLNPCTCLHGFC